MDIISLYNAYHIDYKTEGHKHCRPGWVNCVCPFCKSDPGHEGYHLGIEIGKEHFVCWRCGGHSLLDGIMALLNVDKAEAYRLIKEYHGTSHIKHVEVNLKKKRFTFPTHTTDLEKRHLRYLEERGFDPEYIVKHWNLQGTGPVATVDNISYKHRIIIPIYWNNEIVTYQGRDITNKQPQKYLACPKIREKIHHKHIVYAHPENWEKMKGGTGICTEGVTDVWRLGDSAFCTFGIKYKVEQVRVIAKHFKRVAVFFDDEPQASEQAEKMIGELQFRGVDAFRVMCKGDPGGLPQEEADYMVKQITGRKF